MRGEFRDQGGLFSYVDPEDRIPAGHPLRKVRALVREVLKDLSRSFSKLYSPEGRPSIPPEQLLSALLLQVSTASGRSGCRSSSSTTTCCSAGSSGCGPTIGCGRHHLHQEPRAPAAGRGVDRFMAKLLGHPKVKGCARESCPSPCTWSDRDGENVPLERSNIEDLLDNVPGDTPVLLPKT